MIVLLPPHMLDITHLAVSAIQIQRIPVLLQRKVLLHIVEDPREPFTRPVQARMLRQNQTADQRLLLQPQNLVEGVGSVHIERAKKPAIHVIPGHFEVTAKTLGGQIEKRTVLSAHRLGQEHPQCLDRVSEVDEVLVRVGGPLVIVVQGLVHQAVLGMPIVIDDGINDPVTKRFELGVGDLFEHLRQCQHQYHVRT